MRDTRRPVKYTYSSSFWMHKAVFLLLAFLLGWLFVWLLNYEKVEEVVTPAPVPPAAEQTAEPEPAATPEPAVAPSVPEVLGLPFTIDIPAGVEEPTQAANTSIYTYTLEDGATLTINLDGSEPRDADLRWTHDLTSVNETLNLVQKSEQLCAADEDGCAAGNGILEISVDRDQDTYRAVNFFIADTVESHQPGDALELYQALLESFTLTSEVEG